MGLAEQIRSYWDIDAATYDRASDHRPTALTVQTAWATAVARLLPAPPARVLDCGAGTGFLSLIAARHGHKVTALDVSPRMLDRLRARVDEEGVGIEVVEGSAAEPPAGPFDAVIERHLLWTLPDPIAALRAWRRAAPMGRLVLFEGLWGGADRVEAWRTRTRDLARKLRQTRPHHHDSYDQDMVDALPFGRGTHPSQVIAAVVEAGWPDPWIERLRDVEWASTLELRLPERLLGVTPRFVVTAG